jgi:hypothetical protein
MLFEVIYALVMGGLGYVLQWSVADLVWNLWLSGFLTAIVTVILNVFRRTTFLKGLAFLIVLPLLLAFFGTGYALFGMLLHFQFPIPHLPTEGIRHLSPVAIQSCFFFILRRYWVYSAGVIGFSLLRLVRHRIKKHEHSLFDQIFDPFGDYLRFYIIFPLIWGFEKFGMPREFHYLVVALVLIPWIQVTPKRVVIRGHRRT